MADIAPTATPQAQAPRLWNRILFSQRVLLYAAFAVAGLMYQSYGLPETWGSDELSGVVAGMIRRQTWNPGNFNYPAGLLIHISYLVTRALTCMNDSHFADLGSITRVCRCVNLCFYLLTIRCIEGAISVLTRQRYVNLALLMAGTTCALLVHAHLAESNPGFFFGIALTVFQSCRLLRSGRPRDFYLVVCAASLAVGCKYNAIHLFAGLPVMWLICFRPYRAATFLKHLTVSLALAPLPFFLTNPFVLLDMNTAFADVRAVAVTEAPWFQSHLSWLEFIRHFNEHCNGFFSPILNSAMQIVLIIGLIGFLLSLMRKRRFPPASEERLALHGLVLAAVLFGSYAALAYHISIFQSRYLVPLAMYYSFASLICWYQLPLLRGLASVGRARRCFGPPWQFLFSALHRTLQAGALMLLACVGLSQLYALATAPRMLATTFVQRVAEESSDARIGLVSYPGRSAFRRGNAEVEHRLDEFVTMIAPADASVDTWPKYLDVIQAYFEARRPQLIVMEDIVMHWTVFLPQCEHGDFSRRFYYVNPGPDEWQRRMRSIGYRLQRVFRGTGSSDRFGRCLEAIIGRSYLRVAAEGRGGDVYVFQRMTDTLPTPRVDEPGLTGGATKSSLSE